MENKITSDLDCEQAELLINEYLDGELDAETKAAVEAHLNRCDSCRQIYSQLRDICEAVSDCREEVPAGLHKSIMSAVKAESRAARRRRFASRFGVGIAAILCFGLIATVTVRQMGQFNTGDTTDNFAINSALRQDKVDHPKYDDVDNNGGIAAAPAETSGVKSYTPEEMTEAEIANPTSTKKVTDAAADCTMAPVPADAPVQEGDNSDASLRDDICGNWGTDDWTLVLSTDGTFTFTGKSTADKIQGSYTYSGGLLSLKYNGVTSVYTVSVSDNILTFSHCSGDKLLP